MHRRRRQQGSVFAPLPRVLDLSQQLRHPKREYEVGEGLEIRLQTPAVKNVEVLRSEYNYLLQPYETEVPREATGRTASSLGNPTITKLPRVLDSGTEAAHEVLRQAVDAAIDAQDWLEVWIITRQARVWYDSWLVKGNATEKPWWMLQAEAASGDGVTEHVDLSQDAAPATDLTSGDGAVAAVVKRERTDDKRHMTTLPVPILQSMSGCRVTRTRTDLVVATCNADLWPERFGLAKALDEDNCLSVVSFLDLSPCVRLLSTNRSLRKQLRSRPVRRKAAGKRAWYLVVQSMKALENCTKDKDDFDVSLSESAKAELALIVKEFPEALEERHLPPYATSTDGSRRSYRSYSRLFSEPQGGPPLWEPELYSGESGEGWHGKLPDSAITPLELAVSWPEVGALGLLEDLIGLGSQVTELALDITTSNYAYDPGDNTGCWINLLLREAPHLVSTTQYNLDYLTEYVSTDRHDFMIWIEDDGLVPEVGKTHEADGPFSQTYGQALEGWLANAALGQKRCGKCGELKPRRNFSDKGWAASNDDEVQCKRCEPPAWQVPVPLGTPRARTCSSCKLHLVAAAFSRGQRKKGDSARCRKCTTAAGC